MSYQDQTTDLTSAPDPSGQDQETALDPARSAQANREAKEAKEQADETAINNVEAQKRVEAERAGQLQQKLSAKKQLKNIAKKQIKQMFSPWNLTKKTFMIPYLFTWPVDIYRFLKNKKS